MYAPERPAKKKGKQIFNAPRTLSQHLLPVPRGRPHKKKKKMSKIQYLFVLLTLEKDRLYRK